MRRGCSASGHPAATAARPRSRLARTPSMPATTRARTHFIAALLVQALEQDRTVAARSAPCRWQAETEPCAQTALGSSAATAASPVRRHAPGRRCHEHHRQAKPGRCTTALLSALLPPMKAHTPSMPSGRRPPPRRTHRPAAAIPKEQQLDWKIHVAQHGACFERSAPASRSTASIRDCTTSATSGGSEASNCSPVEISSASSQGGRLFDDSRADGTHSSPGSRPLRHKTQAPRRDAATSKAIRPVGAPAGGLAGEVRERIAFTSRS